jgi:hypothetical protein
MGRQTDEYGRVLIVSNYKMNIMELKVLKNTKQQSIKHTLKQYQHIMQNHRFLRGKQNQSNEIF